MSNETFVHELSKAVMDGRPVQYYNSINDDIELYPTDVQTYINSIRILFPQGEICINLDKEYVSYDPVEDYYAVRPKEKDGMDYMRTFLIP